MATAPCAAERSATAGWGRRASGARSTRWCLTGGSAGWCPRWTSIHVPFVTTVFFKAVSKNSFCQWYRTCTSEYSPYIERCGGKSEDLFFAGVKIYIHFLKTWGYVPYFVLISPKSVFTPPGRRTLQDHRTRPNRAGTPENESSRIRQWRVGRWFCVVDLIHNAI